MWPRRYKVDQVNHLPYCWHYASLIVDFNHYSTSLCSCTLTSSYILYMGAAKSPSSHLMPGYLTFFSCSLSSCQVVPVAPAGWAVFGFWFWYLLYPLSGFMSAAGSSDCHCCTHSSHGQNFDRDGARVESALWIHVGSNKSEFGCGGLSPFSPCLYFSTSLKDIVRDLAEIPWLQLFLPYGLKVLIF